MATSPSEAWPGGPRRRTRGAFFVRRPLLLASPRLFKKPPPGRRDGPSHPSGLPQCRPGPARRGGPGAPDGGFLRPAAASEADRDERIGHQMTVER
ncbi:Hypothetical predicted protein [Podarcis lilfordi]|uniref:Uncharacterized protein n=1 Tax=Podarcis lilfordi TaxID=74358 RepID=A0AA35P0K1_9SAUR|nr:Hypothetical predicted protein [Podarcis lilfordi]